MNDETKNWLLQRSTGYLHVLDILNLGPNSIYPSIGVYGIPYDRAVDLIVQWNNAFVDLLPSGFEDLTSMISFMAEEVETLDSAIEKEEGRHANVERLETTIDALSKDHDRLGDAVSELPDAFSKIENMDAFTIQSEGIDAMNLFASRKSLTDVAEYLRQEAESLEETVRQLSLTRGTIQLRLDLLSSILRRYQLYGVTPDKLDRNDVAAKVDQQKQKESPPDSSRRGRPLKAAPGVTNADRVQVLTECLRDPEFWHFNGRHEGKPRYREISLHLATEHPDLVKGNGESYPHSGKLPITPERIKSIIDRSEIDLSEVRAELGVPDPN